MQSAAAILTGKDQPWIAIMLKWLAFLSWLAAAVSVFAGGGGFACAALAGGGIACWWMAAVVVLLDQIRAKLECHQTQNHGLKHCLTRSQMESLIVKPIMPADPKPAPPNDRPDVYQLD